MRLISVLKSLLFQEAITGAVPFANLSERAMLWRAMNKRKCPERPAECLPAGSIRADTLWTLLTKCWEFDPMARPSAAEVEEMVCIVITFSPLLLTNILVTAALNSCGKRIENEVVFIPPHSQVPGDCDEWAQSSKLAPILDRVQNIDFRHFLLDFYS